MLGLCVLCAVILVSFTSEEDVWKSLEEKHLADEQIKVKSGTYFKYKLPIDDSSYKLDSTYDLPDWLHYDEKRNKLRGIPTDDDVNTKAKIRFREKNENAINGVDGKLVHLNIDVLSKSEENLECDSQPATVGSIIFHNDINKIKREDRVKFLRGVANRMDVKLKDLYLEVGNRMENNLGDRLGEVRNAGPGDKVNGQERMFTVSWKIKCGTDITGNPAVRLLLQLSATEDFSTHFSLPVLGWFVTTAKRRHMYRRALPEPIGATPTLHGLTPTVLQPSVHVRATKTRVKPSPTKSVKTVISSTVPPVPTTITTTTPASTEKNNPPVLVNDINQIDVFTQQAAIRNLPNNLFYDKDNDPLKLELKYFSKNDNKMKALPAGYWMEFAKDKLYMLPGGTENGTHRFTLTATDPKGAYVNAIFNVVVRSDQIFYNHLFNVTLEEEFNAVNGSSKRKVKLVQRLAKASRSDYSTIRALEFLPGSVVIRWGMSLETFNECNDPDVQVFLAQLHDASFKERFLPSIVLDTGMVTVTECDDTTPVIVDHDESSIWQRILIPVIVILIILLIIALILCCVYKRRRQYELKDDDDYVRSQKKPVIFREEYDEKQPEFVCLQPLILPNEKPPVPSAYEPRTGTPDEPESSTASIESDERSPLAPSSPSDNNRKGFNSPPPYKPR